MDGSDKFRLPNTANLRMHREFMTRYLQSYDEIRRELGAVLERIAIDNTVVVSTANESQSKLMANFACSARARGLDVSNWLVFPTDDYTRDLAEGMGIATYFAEKVRFPS